MGGLLIILTVFIGGLLVICDIAYPENKWLGIVLGVCFVICCIVLTETPISIRVPEIKLFELIF